MLLNTPGTAVTVMLLVIDIIISSNS